MSESELWTVTEVAAFLKVSRGHVYRLTSKNQIPFVRLGSGVRFVPTKIRSWLEAKTVEAVR